MFITTLKTVAVMMLFAVPGFAMVKTKMVKPESTPAFAVLLMYICQPCLAVYSFSKVVYSPELMRNIVVFFVLALSIIVLIMGIFYLILKKKQENVSYRIAVLSMCFGNVTFMGLPLVEALLPQYEEAAIYSTVFYIAMNIVGWTAGSALITRDIKYCKPLKTILNPAVAGLVIALVIMISGITLPEEIENAVTLVGKMSTPLCMIILGMRLATVKIKSLLSGKIKYISIFVKQAVMPILGMLMTHFLPIDDSFKITFYILCCCPVAAVVQNFAEMLGEGQEEAANSVLMGTLISIISLPVMLLPV